MGFDERGQKIFEFMQDRTGIKLNESQKQMVYPSEHPIITSAVPGAGKTNTLGLAVASKELIEGVPGNKIYVMTFTNKATNEFKHRHELLMKKIQPNLRSNVNVSTIHSMCKRYVELFSPKLGMREVKGLDENEAKDILKRAIATILGLKEVQVNMSLVNDVLSCIGFMNNRMIYEREEVIKTQHFIDLEMDFYKFKEIRDYFTYTQRTNCNLSFDEWMVSFHELLSKHKDVREAIQGQLQALYVDEFQDTTPLQFEIIKMLKAPKTSLTVVGDQDQTIYRWRGASQIFNDFMATYPEHRLVKMDINYRCPDYIIDASNALIRNNRGRIDIKAKGTGKQGKLQVFGTSTNHESALIISKMIIEEYLASGKDNYTLLDKLVLYRNHSQAMFLLYELARNEVPVNTSGAQLPHKDKIVKDLCDIVYLLRNPRSSVHASRYLHMVSTQLKKPKNLQECPFYTSSEQEHFMKIQINVPNFSVYSAEMEKLLEISYMLRDGKPASEIFQRLLPMYYDAYYKRYNIFNLLGKTEEDLLAIESFLLHDIPKDYDFDQFMYMVNKVEQFLINSNKDNYGLKVFTVHSAKGLEAKQVYYLDSNGSIQPNKTTIRKLVDNNAVEALDEYITEERSIFFVAITRTLQDLVMTYNKNNPSPFNLESSLNTDFTAVQDAISIETLGLKRREELSNKQMEIINQVTGGGISSSKDAVDIMFSQTSHSEESRLIKEGKNPLLDGLLNEGVSTKLPSPIDMKF